MRLFGKVLLGLSAVAPLLVYSLPSDFNEPGRETLCRLPKDQREFGCGFAMSNFYAGAFMTRVRDEILEHSQAITGTCSDDKSIKACIFQLQIATNLLLDFNTLYRNGNFHIYGHGVRGNEALDDGPSVFPAADDLKAKIEKVMSERHLEMEKAPGATQEGNLDSMGGDLREAFARLGTEVVWHIDDYYEMKAAANRRVEQGEDEDHTTPDDLDNPIPDQDQKLDEAESCKQAFRHHGPRAAADPISLCDTALGRALVKAMNLNLAEPDTHKTGLCRVAFLTLVFLSVILLGRSLFPKRTATAPKTGGNVAVEEKVMVPEDKAEDTKVLQHGAEYSKGTEDPYENTRLSPEVQKMRELLNALDQEEQKVKQEAKQRMAEEKAE